MLNLPVYIPIVFVATTLLAIYFVYKASPKPGVTLTIIGLWLMAQGIIALTGFYHNTTGLPPRFVLLVAPPMVLIAMLFITTKGRQFIDAMNPVWLTALHTVRIIIEVILYSLFIYKFIPRIMTFEGHNLDILSGLTALVILYFGYYKKVLGKTVLLIWNFICLGLLLNILVTAILSAPFAFQQFGFEQPNIAIVYFPFIWLPCFIVPAVLFAHLVSIRQLIKK